MLCLNQKKNYLQWSKENNLNSIKTLYINLIYSVKTRQVFLQEKIDIFRYLDFLFIYFLHTE